MTQGHYPRHSMSMYASKDDMLTAVMKENEELHAQLVAESARTAEQKLRADQISKQHDMQCKMHKEAVERAMRAEAELEAVGAGGVQRLAISTQPCSRSHPHEEMTPMCELRTEIARLTNALARAEAQLAAAPQAVQAESVAALPWPRAEVDDLLERLVSSHISSFIAGERGSNKPEAREFVKSALVEAAGFIRAVLQPLHPAEGVPAQPLQMFESPRAKILMQAWQEGFAACRDAEYVGEEAENDAFNQSMTLNHCIAEDELHATHPTQQGLEPTMFWDADDPERCESSINNVVVEVDNCRGLRVGDIVTIQRAVRLPNLEVRITQCPDAEGNGDLEWDEVVAAQAKQGGA